jgi:hypothetical protein
MDGLKMGSRKLRITRVTRRPPAARAALRCPGGCCRACALPLQSSGCSARPAGVPQPFSGWPPSPHTLHTPPHPTPHSNHQQQLPARSCQRSLNQQPPPAPHQAARSAGLSAGCPRAAAAAPAGPQVSKLATSTKMKEGQKAVAGGAKGPQGAWPAGQAKPGMRPAAVGSAAAAAAAGSKAEPGGLKKPFSAPAGDGWQGIKTKGAGKKGTGVKLSTSGPRPGRGGLPACPPWCCESGPPSGGRGGGRLTELLDPCRLQAASGCWWHCRPCAVLT